jgi:hypothetical protein
LTTLIAYDLLIVRRSATAAFSRVRDLLLLAFFVLVGVAVLAGSSAGAEGLEVARGWPSAAKAGMAGLAGLVVFRAVSRRLEHLRENSAVARLRASR